MKLVIDIYLQIKPDPSNIKINTPTYLRPVIHREVNNLLDALESERGSNTQLQNLLKLEENKPVLQLLISKQRLPS